MKSATSIQLESSWWKKEQPGGLKKSASDFEKALVAYEKVAKKPEGDENKFEAALKGLEKAAKDVISEAKALERSASDKKVKEDLRNTISVMDRPLNSAIADERKRLAEMAAASDEDDEDGLANPEAYLAHFARYARLLRNGKLNFALGMPSSNPIEMRLIFHRKQQGKALAAKLRKEIGAKKVTFGIAGTDAMVESLGEEVGKRTLVLDILGPPFPSPARRVRKMLKLLKVPGFNKVRILIEGREAESSDENDTDEDLVAFEADDTADSVDEAPTDTIDGAGDNSVSSDAAKWATLYERLMPKVTAVTSNADPRAEQIDKVWQALVKRAATDPTAALAAAPNFIKLLQRTSTGPELTGKPETPDQLSELGNRLKALATAGKTAVGQRPALRDAVVNAITAAKAALDSGDGETCRTELDQLERVIAASAAAPSEATREATDTIKAGTVAFRKALLDWQGMRGKAMSEMAKLQAAIEAQLQPLVAEEPDIAEVIAESKMLVKRLDLFDERLDDIIKDIISADGDEREALIREGRALLKEYRDALGDEFFRDVDSKNGFQDVEVAASLTKSLSAIEQLMV